MKVLNRDGELTNISFDAVKQRIESLCSLQELEMVDIDVVVTQTVNGFKDGISTFDLDELSARVCANMQSIHYMYDEIAARIIVSNMAKTVRRIVPSIGSYLPGFSDKVAYISRRMPRILDPSFVKFVEDNAVFLDSVIHYDRDSKYHSYFSIRTLQRSYLIQDPDKVYIESPQDLWMRVAIVINMGDTTSDLSTRLDNIQKCYNSMSIGEYTHATPTLFNAGMSTQQMCSCFLVGMEDSLSGIYSTLGNCALISKWAGGIGLHVSNVRAEGSRIASTGGSSDGIIPMLKVFNETARYCNQSGRRKGSFAVYLEPWHADIWKFVELRLNTGAETERARDIFLALWVPDEFMRRLENDEDWYLMSPDICPGLVDACGDAFSDLYCRYIREGRYVKKISARVLWQHVLKAQVETGTPYIMYKDSVNRKCNQSNVGTIRSSNLCAEITQYSDENEYAVCNLASIAIPKFVDPNTRTINHKALHNAAWQLTYNLNRIIDINTYPVPQAELSNRKMRPIGIGIQGMGDVYCMLKLPYASNESIELDACIMETIYHGALTASIELAEKHGPYEFFAGSPASRGILQFDMWNKDHVYKPTSSLYDWDMIRSRIIQSGLRNSMLTALMPTASTSQILGNCESFEPFQSNVFKRTTLAGQFLVVNRHLMRELMERGLWDTEMRVKIIENNGSVQNIPEIPEEIKQIYLTVWEIPQRHIIEHAAARGPYVDQSQSMNIYMMTPNTKILRSILHLAWKRGLKTGMYYLRSLAASEATKFGISSDTTVNSSSKPVVVADNVCQLRKKTNENDDDDGMCLMCSS